MNTRKPHKIWIEQCEATSVIRQRYGLKAAFDYAVAEKLLNFASAASQHPSFARELPRFVAQVRQLFTPEEIRTHIERIERDRNLREAEDPQDDDMATEDPETGATRSHQFDMIKELLTATQLGTS
jgi:hypothetical protein